jgi:hypothetical protein
MKWKVIWCKYIIMQMNTSAQRLLMSQKNVYLYLLIKKSNCQTFKYHDY